MKQKFELTVEVKKGECLYPDALKYILELDDIIESVEIEELPIVKTEQLKSSNNAVVVVEEGLVVAEVELMEKTYYLGTFKAVLRSGSVNSRVQVLLHSDPSCFYTTVVNNALLPKIPMEKFVVGVFSKPFNDAHPDANSLCFERFAVWKIESDNDFSQKARFPME